MVETLTQYEWNSKAHKLSTMKAIDNSMSYQNLRKMLVQLNTLMLEAPTSIRQLYTQFDEKAIKRATALQVAKIYDENFAWTHHQDINLSVKALGVQIRAIDQVLAELHFQEAIPENPTESWFCENAFVIPRRFRRHSSDSQPYGRRGIVHHRILPAIVGGYKVHLYRSESARTTPEEWLLAAAMFRDFSLRCDTNTDGGIVASGVSCNEGVQAINDQLTFAYNDQSTCLVWPELTMPPDFSTAVVRGVKDRLYESQHRPQIIIPGSWHLNEKDKASNVCVVYDGYGEILLTYQKILRYNTKLEYEEIVPGDKLPVLVTEDLLVGFAICRDFCEGLEDSTVYGLDVDLVIVPSFGNKKTIDAHLEMAKRLNLKFKTKACVVQQLDEVEKGQLGYVIGAPVAFGTAGTEIIPQNGIYACYKASLATPDTQRKRL